MNPLFSTPPAFREPPMPAIELKNLIIFGDSMSDIGNKREQGMGRVARVIKMMRTNDVGRFSDTRNWTDFLWEWAGGRRLVWKDQATSYQNTLVHRTLSRDSNQDSGFGRPFYYCNYAEGGAMGASDRPGTGLGTFKTQVETYIEQRKLFPLTGPTMHIIWFGLNDLVTNERPPDTMGKVVEEIGRLMLKIDIHFGRQDHHYMVVNLPSPAGAQRYLQKNELRQVFGLEKGTQVFNEQLNGLIDGRYYKGKPNVSVVDMFSFVNDINDRPQAHNLVNKSQPHGVKVDYGMFGAGGDAALRRYVATSDDAHPTEAVYKLMGKCIATDLRARYSLGSLSNSRLV
jgi:phospholipase/lecithinase/hemolysin